MALLLFSGWHCAAADDETAPPPREPDRNVGQSEAGVVYQSDGSTGSPDAGADAAGEQDGGRREDGAEHNPWQRCGGRCPDDTPYCDGQSGRCLACVVGDPDFSCPSSAPICKVDDETPDDVAANTCVECLDQNDCDRFCDPSTNLCVSCFVVEDGRAVGCSEGDGKPVCKTSTVGARNGCVECIEDDECESATGGPICDPEANRCVQCLEDAQCHDPSLPHCGEKQTCIGCEGESHCAHLPETPFCRLDTGICVQCLDNQQCLDPAASRCDTVSGSCRACAGEDDCTHLQGLAVCDIDPADSDNSRCVQCADDDYSACAGYKNFVCNSVTRTCSTEFEVASAEVCDGCVADAHCKQGMICVLATFGPEELEVGHFCYWMEGEPGAPEDCALDGRPFADTIVEAVSIDGRVATICALGASTCPALQDAKFPRSCDPFGDINKQCGHPDFEDGFCLQVSANDSRCTIPCDIEDDCPVDSVSCATVNQRLVCEM